MSENQRRIEFEKMDTAEIKLYVLMDPEMSKKTAWHIFEVVSDRLASLEATQEKPAIGTSEDVELADLREIKLIASVRCK